MGLEIGIVRTATALRVRVFSARRTAKLPTGEFTVELLPLDARQPEHTPLVQAWDALAAVSEWNATTLDHVLTVLRGTVPDAGAIADQPALPALDGDVLPPPPPRATAANPRAFKGTKFQPPKPSQIVVDVRPYLLARRTSDQVLRLLNYAGPPDPYVAQHFDVTAAPALAPWFVSELLPIFTAATWAQVNEFAVLAQALGLRDDHELRNSVIMLSYGTTRYGVSKPELTLAWLHYVHAHPAEQRSQLLHVLHWAGAYYVAPPAPHVATAIAPLTPTQQVQVYKALSYCAAPAYLLSGVALGVIPTDEWSVIPLGRQDVTKPVGAAIEWLAETMKVDSGADFWRGRLWQMCGMLPTLAPLLSSLEFSRLHPAAAFEIIRCYSALARSDMPTALEVALERAYSKLAALAVQVPDAYQCKFVTAIRRVDWEFADSVAMLDATFARIAALARRIARAPFTTQKAVMTVVAELAHFEDPATLAAFVEADDASWLTLEHAAARNNRAVQVRFGLNMLERKARDLLHVAFAHAPGPLMQTAVRLKDFTIPAAEQLLVTYAATPLAQLTVVDLPLGELCALIAPIAAAGGPNPVRRALRVHLDGGAQLTDKQIAQHRARIIAELTVIRLAAIRQAADRELASRVGQTSIASEALRHGLGMLGDARRNRRVLRNFLRAHAAGDHSWVRRHPRTLHWLKQHPALVVEDWLAGVTIDVTIDGIGPVHIAVENDPLEALKLGTYVGSCLGRGGILEDSAVAPALDINKQVIYARDQHGAVVGRQLVAISERNQLVCFAVYGNANNQPLLAAFREFDRALAAKVKLPIYDKDAAATDSSNDEDYEIAVILSHEWWDDGAWQEKDEEED